ncbi:MAG: heme-binding protein [Rhodoferax sp.]|jgi:hypothetical protein|uniref:SOUL family heme-binding protein n=1 Tax=Rhodoferax sp. TaxID=50421 RepID=UPI002731DBDE|nr:heme-binding protein [Rhodoferax sp.]MDP1531475.1 heme-binding protein [Rhodoferax sp.]MDP1945271.1 heme-binding protein [Rhodoferax sp.]
MATEEPKFEVLSQHGHIELRRYPAFVIAETTVEGDMDAASGKGFRAIADYIFGNNQAKTPAADPTSEKIAMTAPVAMEPLASPAVDGLPAMKGATQWRMHFVMPSQYTLATLPQPNNPAVRLRKVPAKTWAVLSYSGFNTEAKIQEKTDALVAWLAGQKIKSLGSPQLARYDPPWTLPMFRRNEIMLEIQQP